MVKDININNPIEIRMVGLDVLKKTLGPVGMVKFLQQFQPGYGDYTDERQANDITFEDLDAALISNQ